MLCTLLALCALLLSAALPLRAAEVRLLRHGPEGLEVEITVDGEATAALEPGHWPGLARLEDEGLPPLPYLARLLAAPPGARLRLQVEDAAYEQFEGVGPALAGPDAFLPGERAGSESLGILRGVEAHALRLYPFAYNPARRTLRLYRTLRVSIRFEGGARPRPARPDPVSAPLYAAFLNPPPAPRPRPAARLAADWYDPARPWLKVFVEEDGLYRITPEWLAAFADTAAIDPRTLRLFYLGQEQALYVAGEEDGRFNGSDGLFFHGHRRRDERDFVSLYGARNTYWLTWGQTPGRRLGTRSGAPLNEFPQERSFATTTHFEQDLHFDPLSEAADNQRDHWFWRESVKATRPDIPSSAIFAGELLHPDLLDSGPARLRVALHGATDLGHHTVLKFNNELVDDRIWGGSNQGQVELLVEREIPTSYLSEGTNRLLLQVFADQEKFDWVYLNWFAIDHRRRHQAWFGYLEFAHPPSAGRRISVTGLRHPQVELWDLASGARLTEAEIVDGGTLFHITFEDSPADSARYLVADSLAFKSPRGERDQPSSWKASAHRAEYLIVAHPDLMAPALRLAAHHRARGLEVEVVSAQDAYDEFSFGRTDREAIRALIRHAYHTWEKPPAYVLLLGDDTYDYRNIQGGGEPTSTPSLYYQSRGRGHAPSDFFYALVDGDDLLADLAVGRLAASDPPEAELLVERIIRYDTDLETGPWRQRVLYLANHHPKAIFSAPSDSLAARFTEPYGLHSVRIYNADESPIPNPTGRLFLEELNQGALLVNFNGHGSPGTLQSLFSLNLPDWGYMSQVRNGARLPLVLALSCLNGLFANPTLEGLAEVFTAHPHGGALAYISATAKSFVAQNDLLSERFYAQLFGPTSAPFGPALNAAKAQVLAAHSSWVDAALTMQLMGDPAQKLALPSGPEYEAVDLRLEGGPARGHATLPVELSLRNNGLPGADSLLVLALGRQGEAVAETLFAERLPPFSGQRLLSFPWPLGARRGAYRLELRLDPQDRIAESDESNNERALQVEIQEPLCPLLLFPPPSGGAPPDALRLEAVLPLQGGPYLCEFALSTDPDFAAGSTLLSPPIAPEQGLAAHAPLLAADTAYFWRARLLSDRAPGPWSPARTFRSSAAPAPWNQRGTQLLAGQVRDLALSDQRLALSDQRRPFRPSSARREDGFTVRNLQGAGVLVTDGTWLYAKRWYNDDSTIYPGTDVFTRIGTGLNNTIRAGYLGTLGDTTTAGISATYHADGYIYNESGKAFELERLSVATGKLDTVQVSAGLLEWKTGRVQDGHSLITSDGRLIYNVAMSDGEGMRNAWKVRVFDPQAGWQIAREFTSPPTETGFTYEWTDGVLADGERLYLIEWQGGRRIRMIDAVDGTLLDEWTSDQDTTRIITGQYDWVNDKVWLGDLWGSAVFRYSGLEPVREGELVSEEIGPAARWQGLDVRGQSVLVDLLVRRGEQWLPHPDFQALQAGAHSLQTLDAREHAQIRLRARLQSPDAYLEAWAADFVPRPSLQVAQAAGDKQGDRLQVSLQIRNLSPFPVGQVRLRLEQSGRLTPLAEIALDTLERGETRLLRLGDLEVPPARARLYAQLVSPLADADAADDRLEIPLFFEGRAPLAFYLWPGERPFLSGDPLLPGQGLLLDAPDLPGARLQVHLDGRQIEPDSTIDAFPQGQRLLFRPALQDPGEHLLEARLLDATGELGSARLRLRQSDALRLASALLYPHPVRDRASFTYVLSHPAEVSAEIYSVAGRLLERLGPLAQQAGFQQLDWDASSLAAGTYLFRLRARSGDQEALFRGPLVILR